MQLIRKTLAFGQLPSSKGDLYVPDSGRKGFVHNVELHNANTSAETVILNYHDGTGEHQVYKVSIDADDTVQLDFRGEGTVVDDGAKITGSTTTATQVTYKLSGTEEIPDAVAAGGGGAEVLWEWNGTDITQFGNGAGTPDSTYGSPDGTLSVGAVPTAGIDVPSGDVLLYTTGTATTTAAFFFINDLPTLPERFLYRARIGPYAAGCAPILILAAQDATHSVGFTWYTTQTTFQMGNNNSGIFEGGLYLRSAGPNSANHSSGLVLEADVMLRDPDTGVDPQINIIIDKVDVVGHVKGGHSWSTWGGSSAAYHSSWQSGGTIKKPGFCFTCNGTSQVGWISELQILSHPWTKEA